jgi:ribonuclease HI
MINYYAVRVGRSPGIYRNWNDCKREIENFSNAIYKKFDNEKDAINFLNSYSIFINSDSVQNLNKRKNELQHEKTDENESLLKKKCYLNNTDYIVYTDGACKNNGKETASAGIGVFWGDNNPLNISEKLIGKQTNQRAELNAAIKAIEQAISLSYKSITLYTDSLYTIKCIKEWVTKWKKNNWIKSNNEPVENKQDILKLDNLCSLIYVNWKHIPGHKGIYGNEEADKLAKKAIN